MHKKDTLDNGIRVVTEGIPHVRSASLGVWVDVGARDEEPEINGVSHFIEHMLFKGTESRAAGFVDREAFMRQLDLYEISTKK